MARRLNPEDAALWARIAEDIDPLSPHKRNRLSQGAEIEAEPGPGATTPKPTPKSTPRPRSAAPLFATNINENRVNAEKKPHADVDRRTFDRLRKGKMPIDGRLDLHGHTQQSAHRALDAFIEAAYDAGRRCVLVITGKGFRGEEGRRGVLREKVPQWLSSPKLNPLIVSTQPAQPRDGGDGALYVLIRRRR